MELVFILAVLFCFWMALVTWAAEDKDEVGLPGCFATAILVLFGPIGWGILAVSVARYMGRERR